MTEQQLASHNELSFTELVNLSIVYLMTLLVADILAGQLLVGTEEHHVKYYYV
jgi:hypothetical protein